MWEATLFWNDQVAGSIAARHRNTARTNVPTISAKTFSPTADAKRDDIFLAPELLKRFLRFARISPGINFPWQIGPSVVKDS
jgi:hypothetical protein